jgi:N-acetylmuramoyl-L-alanine amidase
MTSESLYLMKGGTGQYLDKVDLTEHGVPANQEFKLEVPITWLSGSDVPRIILIDVGSTQKPDKATINFDADDILSKVIKRSDWDAAPPLSRFELVDRPQFIVIHHTETPPVSSDLNGAKSAAKSVQQFHMTPEPRGRGWSDIGYSFLNTIGGILVEGRFGSLEEAIKGNAVRGAHAGTDAGNRAPGVSNEGNFGSKAMDAQQWDSLVSMCAALCQSCNIDPSAIRGHRDFVPTQCPGDWLYGQLGRLKKEVAQKLAG